ncbi:NAD(P)-binding protein [Hortaea werneckii]|nr:NAD(P)-binding protein [Hortaea werneckii]
MSTFDCKAWTYDAPYPAGLKITTIQTPRANDIKSLGTTPHMLLKLKACALNPVDIQMMNLLASSWMPGKSKPKTTVCDFSGEVIAGGRTGFIQHDEVFGITMKPFDEAGGALSEMAQFNMANSCAVKKPASWTHEQAAAIPLVWLTARTCIENVAYHVESHPSKRVAVLGGSSAVGIYTILIAKRRGWKVITTSSSRNKDFVTNTLKADAHVDYTTQNVRSEVSKFEPVAVVDCVGGTECIGLPSSKRYISIVGDKTSRSSMGGPYTYYNFLSYHAPLQWIRWARGYFGLGESYDVVVLELKKEWLQEAVDTLRPEEIFIDSTFNFEDAKKAFERLDTGRARGKVVVKVQN